MWCQALWLGHSSSIFRVGCNTSQLVMIWQLPHWFQDINEFWQTLSICSKVVNVWRWSFTLGHCVHTYIYVYATDVRPALLFCQMCMYGLTTTHLIDALDYLQVQICISVPLHSFRLLFCSSFMMLTTVIIWCIVQQCSTESATTSNSNIVLYNSTQHTHLQASRGGILDDTGWLHGSLDTV